MVKQRQETGRMTMTNFTSVTDIAGIKNTGNGFKIYSYTWGYYQEVYGTEEEAIEAAKSRGYKETLRLS